ncbi:chorismate-binding protein [Pseudomonas aeruginosa]
MFACAAATPASSAPPRNAWSAFAPARRSPMPWPGPSPAAAMPRKMRLGQALLDSAKDGHEHQLVVEAIRTALEPFSEVLEIPDAPGLKRLARVQHLNTPIRARLADAGGILRLLQALHPTPAVGGYPRSAALDYIRQHEGMDRGWYAAPLGWLDGEGNGDSPGGAALGPAHAGPGLPVRRLRSGRRFGTGPRVSRNLP